MTGWILLLTSVLGVAVMAQPDLKLPKAAVVIERATIPERIHPNRELVLWMLPPQTHDRGKLPGPDSYACPEMLRGSYCSGPTRISLLDTSANTVINTVNLR